MHERRNLVLTLVLIAAAMWGFYVWLVAPAIPSPIPPPSALAHRVGSAIAVFVLAGMLFYAYRVEEKLPDELGRVTMGRAFEREGLCFMPVLRVRGDGPSARAEVSLFFQSRYAGDCEAVIHLRPEAGTIRSHAGRRDIHFAFKASNGAFGVVHQPIAIDAGAQGRSVRLDIAAAVRWPHARGELLRSKRGMACGTFDVDWELAYRQSEHELGGEIELHEPATMTLALPERVATSISRGEYAIEVLSTLDSPARAHLHAT